MRADHGTGVAMEDRPRVRVLALIDGDVYAHGAQAVKHRRFLDALRRHVDVCGVGDMRLRGVARLVCGAAAWRPGLGAWKAHYRANPLAFALRSKQSRRWIAGQPVRPDVVVQVGALSRPVPSPPDIPYALYLDFTFALTNREWPARAPLSPAERMAWLRLEAKAYDDAAVIFTRSRYVARSLRDDYGVAQEKVHVVGAGVNLDLPDPRALPERAAPRALFIGSDFRRKGGDVLLDAWPEVRRRVPAARLAILGRPASPPPDGVEVIGQGWDRELVKRELAAARLFVMPSRCETWGDVFLEAMAYGLPCIGSTADAMPEIIADGVSGFVVPPGDPSALAERLAALLADPDRARHFGVAGRARLEERFLWERVIERMLPALHRAAGRPLGPAAPA